MLEIKQDKRTFMFSEKKGSQKKILEDEKKLLNVQQHMAVGVDGG